MSDKEITAAYGYTLQPDLQKWQVDILGYGRWLMEPAPMTTKIVEVMYSCFVDDLECEAFDWILSQLPHQVDVTTCILEQAVIDFMELAKRPKARESLPKRKSRRVSKAGFVPQPVPLSIDRSEQAILLGLRLEAMLETAIETMNQYAHSEDVSDDDDAYDLIMQADSLRNAKSLIMKLWANAKSAVMSEMWKRDHE